MGHMNDPATFGLTAVNIALGLLVLGCLAVVVCAVLREIMPRVFPKGLLDLREDWRWLRYRDHSRPSGE